MGAAASSRAAAAGEDGVVGRRNIGGGATVDAAPTTTTTSSRGDFFAPIAASVRASPASSACGTPRGGVTEQKTEFAFSPLRYGRKIFFFFFFQLPSPELAPIERARRE